MLLSLKKELKSAICSNIDVPRDYCTVSQTEKDKYHMISPICGI